MILRQQGNALLEIRRQVFQIHDLRDARPRHLRKPGDLGIILHDALRDDRAECDRDGRIAILRRHLAPLRLAEEIDREALIAELAAQTDGASGVDLAYLCLSAARRCVQEAVQAGVSVDAVTLERCMVSFTPLIRIHAE